MRKKLLSVLVVLVFSGALIFTMSSVNTVSAVQYEVVDTEDDGSGGGGGGSGVRCRCSTSEEGREALGTCCHSDDTQYSPCAWSHPNDCNN